MLENNERDNVYYSVRYRGGLLTGYADLPSVAPPDMRDTEVKFGKGVYRGRPVRIVAEARSLPQIASPVVIEVAETLEARERVTRRMMLVLALIEVTMIAVGLGLLPLAVRWGLRPVDQLRTEMDLRAASDLDPLDAAAVPSELRALVEAFNRMLARLDAAIEGMRRFTADASHQMRTPLAILRTHIGVLQRADPGSNEAQVALNDIEEASKRLGHLLVQLLALARADAAGPRALALTSIDLNEIAESVSAERAPEAVTAEIEFGFERAGKALSALGHAELARELLSNLVDNAIRYNRPGGSVHVRVEADGGSPAVVIEDDGPGIAPVDRLRVFDRFTRLRRDSQAPGSGLGLPIALSLARAIGATLELTTPASGKGLRVVVGFTAA
jgi:two-component system sensor histidine kinase TctE